MNCFIDSSLNIYINRLIRTMDQKLWSWTNFQNHPSIRKMLAIHQSAYMLRPQIHLWIGKQSSIRIYMMVQETRDRQPKNSNSNSLNLLQGIKGALPNICYRCKMHDGIKSILWKYFVNLNISVKATFVFKADSISSILQKYKS